ncbi:MAG: aspartate-semialdehyde dehydrogenase [Candidatus Latescibacteria bacterium]|nr:aspartate-semialdehyde dehydrogenase [Candidatus Latescibacterota bacterium]
MEKLRAGILGATGMVGQKFIKHLAEHPWFEVVSVAASARSAGRTYAESVSDRWTMDIPVPAAIGKLMVQEVEKDLDAISKEVDLVFCALDMDKDATRQLEDEYARREVVVVSANSAHRWTPDVPMLIPEINADHLQIIPVQRRRLGTRRGFVTVKPNCSLQPYVPALEALAEFVPLRASVCTYQAISGAGKTFKTWPEMEDNIIPFIGGEEDKSVREPLKIWGRIEGERIVEAKGPVISAQCLRVPVSDGHLAAVSVSFEKKPSKDEILSRWAAFKGKPQDLQLPSAPTPFLRYFAEDNRPQTRLDRDAGNGMAVTLGRLREDNLFDYKFVALSHNTVRGAAGGAILTAELLQAEGYLAKS